MEDMIGHCQVVFQSEGLQHNAVPHWEGKPQLIIFLEHERLKFREVWLDIRLVAIGGTHVWGEGWRGIAWDG